MTTRRSKSRIMLHIFAWIILLPAASQAQQALPSAGGMGVPSTSGGPVLPVPSEPDQSGAQAPATPAASAHDGETLSGALNLQRSFKRTTAGVAYAFTPAGTSEFSGLNSGHSAGQWGNSLVGVFRSYANDSTSFLMTADFETVGQQQAKANEATLPGGGDILLEYLGTRSLSLGVGSHVSTFEVGFGAFQHWMVSSPLSMGGLFRGQLPGYGLYSHGLETTFTLPDSDTSFTVRYGYEHLVNGSERKPTVGFELSWSW